VFILIIPEIENPLVEKEVALSLLIILLDKTVEHNIKNDNYIIKDLLTKNSLFTTLTSTPYTTGSPLPFVFFRLSVEFYF